MKVEAIDLHGLRVHEACEALEKAIDRCILNDEEQLRVIHGFGSGKVKVAILELLRSSPQVKHFRGEMGNAGVTVVYF